MEKDSPASFVSALQGNPEGDRETPLGGSGDDDVPMETPLVPNRLVFSDSAESKAASESVVNILY